MTADALSPRESTRLEKCEAIIENGLRTFVEVGNALLEIRDSRLYRQDFDTFGDYCRKRWQTERRHAYRLINAARVFRNVSPGTQNLPTSEKQIRPLTSLEPEQQREAWDEAVKNAPNGKPTAKDVDAAIDQLKASAKSDDSPKADSWTHPDQGNSGDQDIEQDEQPEIPKGNLKKLVGELWTTALRNVPPKQEIEVAELFLEMLYKKFPELEGGIK